jgi:uncharacterized protein YegP (UPF0339 family)
MTLAWEDKSNDETEFRLYDSSTGNHLFTFAANETTGQATGLSCNTPYTWTLRAANSQGVSLASNTANATTNACN